MDDHDKSEHPISLLASLEYKITPSEDVTELNANIAAMDISEEMHMSQGQIRLEEDPLTEGTNEHLSHKSHIINYIKTSVKSRKPITIDMSNLDFSNGYTPSNPIDLISPMPVDSEPSNKEDHYLPEIASATTVTNALTGEPSANLRNASPNSKKDISNGNDEEFAPLNTDKGKLDLKTFKDYSE